MSTSGIIHCNGIFQCKPSIVGYPNLWKPHVGVFFLTMIPVRSAAASARPFQLLWPFSPEQEPHPHLMVQCLGMPIGDHLKYHRGIQHLWPTASFPQQPEKEPSRIHPKIVESRRHMTYSLVKPSTSSCAHLCLLKRPSTVPKYGPITSVGFGNM